MYYIIIIFFITNITKNNEIISGLPWNTKNYGTKDPIQIYTGLICLWIE